MAQSQRKKQQQKQRKLRQRQAKKQRSIVRNASIRPPELSAKLLRELDEIEQWIDEGLVDHAIELLNSLVRRYPNSGALAEAEHGIYHNLRHHQAAAEAAKRFLKLVPQSSQAMFSYAQASMFCLRGTIALIQFKRFLERWPNHELANQAQKAMEICESECRRSVELANSIGGMELAFEEGGLEFYARHEESLEQMAALNFSEAIKLLEQNIEQQPHFISSRNNLVTCRFYQGDLEEAADAAREICEIDPDNRFAEANLIKVEFLSGNPEQAHDLADSALADPPLEQDSFILLAEALSYLGRDEDLLVLSQLLERVTPLDDDKLGDLLHCFAVANYRLNDLDEALRLWNQCLEICPGHAGANANLTDIDMKTGHAAWSQPFNKWLPRPYILQLALRCQNDRSNAVGSLASENPIVATLVPALLDRGDATGRRFALEFAMTDGSPPMLATLKDFAFHRRGPDALRRKALSFLNGVSEIGPGPHRIYSRGKWTEITLTGMLITHEPVEVESWKQELLGEGYRALHAGDLGAAEQAFQEVVDHEPGCRTARFNLATVWQTRGRRNEVKKAKQVIRKIHAEHPDYSFAALVMALEEADAGNLDRSKQLMKGVLEQPQLHISEAKMLFLTQAQVALIEDDLESAESFWKTLCELVDEDDPKVMKLRQKIDLHQLSRTLAD